MLEYKYDKLLAVKTADKQEADPAQPHYNRYEPTSYAALEALGRKYHLSPKDTVVDMGSGKGRVPFFVNYHCGASVIGVEMSPALYEDAMRNRDSYIRKHRRRTGTVQFECALAQKYEIKPEENIFFFFNPFSEQIFMTVIGNILRSAARFPRSIDILLYYPSPEYVVFLRDQTSFELADDIHIDGFFEKNTHERILIFHLPKGET